MNELAEMNRVAFLKHRMDRRVGRAISRVGLAAIVLAFAGCSRQQPTGTAAPLGAPGSNVVVASRANQITKGAGWNNPQPITAGRQNMPAGFIPAAFNIPLLDVVPSTSSVYNVRDYGAKGDGVTVDSPAIDKAIEAAAAAGGGTVHLPAGKYLCFSIHLKSNIVLYLDSGCTIVAGTPGADGRYDAPEPNEFQAYQDGGHSHWHDALIWGENLHDVSILGPGLIDGNGANGRGLTRGDAGPGAGGRAGVGVRGRGAGGAAGAAATEPAGAAGAAGADAANAGAGNGGAGVGAAGDAAGADAAGGPAGQADAGAGDQAAGDQAIGAGQAGDGGARPAGGGGGGGGPTRAGTPGGGFNGNGFGAGRLGPSTQPIVIANGFGGGAGRGAGGRGGRGAGRGATTGPATRGAGGRGQATPGQGDKAISLKLCRNVTLRDFSILNGGHFGILATGVDNFTIDNLKIDTNRDGMDIDCCRNVRVSNCSVNAPDDDGICLKSSYALGVLRATENVTITNCQVSGYDVGTFLDGTYKRTMASAPDRYGPVGRIKLGTESTGGYKNITISNCVFDYCRGFCLETVDGGPLEDVTVTNLTMRNVGLAPIFIRLGNRARSPAGTPIADCKRILISNINAYNVEPRFGCVIAGLPDHTIDDVCLDNLNFQYWGGGTADMNNINPPEADAGYPEPFMFSTMPSYGFFIRHVTGLEMSNVHLTYITPEARSAFSLDDVKHARFSNIQAEHDPKTPIFALWGVDDFSVHQSDGVTDVAKDHVEEGSY